MPSISHKEFDWTLNLMRRQKAMLARSEAPLLELYRFCDNEEQRHLIEELIIRFNCFDPDIYALALNAAVDYISGLGYSEDETALVAFCHDSSADSSQVVLDDLKVPMAMCGYSHIKTINRFDKICSTYNSTKGQIKHFIAIDEFIGSGKTLDLRMQEFNRLRLSKTTIDFVFLSGMREAISLGKQKGASIYTVYEMEKGISGFYSGEQLQSKQLLMRSLEGKLASRINLTELKDHLFGYHGTEALYCRPEKNVPNNVFPIFWWKKDIEGHDRNTLLIRVQDGY